MMIQVLENAVDTAKKAGIGIGEYASLRIYQILCYLLATKRYPAIFQSAQLALTDVFLCRSLSTIFKKGKEGQKEATELAKCLHSAIFYNDIQK